MSKSKVPIMLLLLCACLMPLTVYQANLVSGSRNTGGDSFRSIGGGVRPTVNIPTSRPNVNVPTARPTFNQPTARPTFSQPTFRPTFSQPTIRPTFSFTQPPVLSSISFSRTMPTSFTFTRSSFTFTSWTSWSSWTWSSFTRTVITTTSYTFNPTFTFATTTSYYPGYYPPYGGWSFIQYPPNYNYNVGSFTLDHTLIGQNGVPCTYYTYFEFNANAGQQLQARLWTPGATIDYIIVPQSLVPILQQMGCGYAQSGPRSQAHSFNSQITLNWTAPETNQYVIIFYSLTPYSGPIYFLPGVQ